jgi:ketosteroid isomerase-like protein
MTVAADAAIGEERRVSERGGPGIMASADADRLREAFASRQLERLIGLMDADVTWRGIQQPGEAMAICHDRDEVREVMAHAIERGTDGRPAILAEVGDSVVVDPRVEPPPPVQLHQVITFRAGRIVLIQDFPDRASAMAAIQPLAASPA